ncbi:MAG: LysE family transporter [Rubrobacter sp.]|nr:LysE family transporter [Rubrobacter sp.]
MSAFVFGLLFGMATILPVGVQSFVVLNQGLTVGYPRVFFGIVTASCCDTLLIVLGAVGVSAILNAPGSREALILVGVGFLLVMGVLALRASSDNDEVKSRMRPAAMVAQTAGVSLLNPHAILETVGILGAAIAAQAAESRVEFATGVISASWVWFLMVGRGASVVQRWLTSSVRLWIQRGSGVLMLALAGILAFELA